MAIDEPIHLVLRAMELIILFPDIISSHHLCLTISHGPSPAETHHNTLLVTFSEFTSSKTEL